MVYGRPCDATRLAILSLLMHRQSNYKKNLNRVFVHRLSKPKVAKVLIGTENVRRHENMSVSLQVSL